MISLFAKKKIVGIDVGTSSIKIAELDVGRKDKTLVSFGMVPSPPQAIIGGDIANVQAVGDAIRQLAQKIQTKRKHAAAGLGGTSVIVKRITIPRMEEKLIAEQIRWEAEQYIPYDINEVNLGFEVLKSVQTNADSMDLLLVAAVQAHVFKYVEALSIAGLNCSLLDVSGFSLANCFKANYGNMSGQSVALLNMGAAATSMVVLENSEVVFCRDIPVGGLNYTMDLQKGLDISIEEAEAIKLSVSKGQSAPAEATTIIQATHDMVAEEIKASFDFFLNSAKSQSITRSFVTGGGIKMTGILDRISKIAPCERLDPFFGIKINPKSFSQEYIGQIRDFAAVAVGLGLREVGDA